MITLIFGLGQTGFSCLHYLSQKGFRLRIADTRLHPPNLEEVKTQFPETELFLGEIPERVLEGVQQVVVSPGIDIRLQAILQMAKARGIPLIGDIEIFARDCPGPYIGITGSNGKTTVTALVGELFKALGIKVGVGGNIGKPALDLLREDKKEVYVLELSSFQLETTDSLAPTVATILNITPDHLDRYDSYEDYVSAKQRILKNAKYIIPEPTLENQDGLVFNKEVLCPLHELGLKGRHNYLNIISALSIVYTFGLTQGLTWDSMKAPLIKVLKNFKGLEHRCQWIDSGSQMHWINDSKGTNIGASLAALHSVLAMLPPSSKLILIAGGDGKNQDFEILRQGLESVQAYLRYIILIGKDRALIQRALKIGESECVETLTQAVHLAAQKACKGDTILLSPSCSSLDQYANYAERGQDFIQAVAGVTGNK